MGNLIQIDYGYITGWAATIVFIAVAPLLIVVIEYLYRINRSLADIKSRLPLPPISAPQLDEGKNQHSRDTHLKDPFPRRL